MSPIGQGNGIRIQDAPYFGVYSGMSQPLNASVRFVLLLTGLLSGAMTARTQTASSRLQDPPVNFHLQAAAIVPSALFRVRPNEDSFDGVDYAITPKPGFQFGGLASFRLNRSFQIHGGITLLRRSFKYEAVRDMQHSDLEMDMTIYELPVLLMYYQRLAPRWLLTAGTGLNMQSILSDLGVKKGSFEILALYRSFASPASLTVAGMEYRMEGKGGLFLGLSYNVTPFPLYDTIFRTEFDGQERLFRLPHVGDYFGIVARYTID